MSRDLLLLLDLTIQQPILQTFSSDMKFDFHFEMEKTLAAVSYILQKAGGSINWINLIKIIYVTDRESFIRLGRTMTGCQMVSLKNGPALDELWKLLNGDENAGFQEKWDTYFTKGKGSGIQRYLLTLDRPFPFVSLSEFEKQELDKAFNKFAHEKFSPLMRKVHDPKEFPEWRWRGAKKRIMVTDILKRVGRKSASEISELHSKSMRWSALCPR